MPAGNAKPTENWLERQFRFREEARLALFPWVLAGTLLVLAFIYLKESFGNPAPADVTAAELGNVGARRWIRIADAELDNDAALAMTSSRAADTVYVPVRTPQDSISVSLGRGKTISVLVRVSGAQLAEGLEHRTVQGMTYRLSGRDLKALRDAEPSLASDPLFIREGDTPASAATGIVFLVLGLGAGGAAVWWQMRAAKDAKARRLAHQRRPLRVPQRRA